MNAIEIKEKRKKLGLTQKELANLVGVSTQTINGYENGKEIPSTKFQILDKILNQKIDISMVQEPNEEYISLSGYDKKILENIEELKERQKLLDTLDKNSNEYKLALDIINYLKESIEIIKLAKENHNK